MQNEEEAGSDCASSIFIILTSAFPRTVFRAAIREFRLPRLLSSGVLFFAYQKRGDRCCPVRSVMPTCVLLCRRAFCYADVRFVMQTPVSLCKRAIRYVNARFVMQTCDSLCHRAFRYATARFVMPPCVSLCHRVFRYATARFVMRFLAWRRSQWLLGGFIAPALHAARRRELHLIAGAAEPIGVNICCFTHHRYPTLNGNGSFANAIRGITPG
jgi:hypothetical protein